jgi:hypothetical protein
MTVFTFSIIVNAAGLNLKRLRFEDLNPRTWAAQADRQRHLIVARMEKFWYDLRVVVEIESRFRQLSSQPQVQEEETPKPAAPGGGSLQGAPSDQTVASNGGAWIGVAGESEQALPAVGSQTDFTKAGRSLNP